MKKRAAEVLDQIRETAGKDSKLFQYVSLALAGWYVIALLYMVARRLPYPFELEWMEGGMVDHVIRILQGHKVYVSPSLEFVPYPYAPLYFYLSAAVAKITGIGFLPLRLISFLATLGSLWLIFHFVKRETNSYFSGAVASCLFAATFPLSGAFFDIARSDSLFIFFLLAALYILRFKTSRISLVSAGMLACLSVLTKQTAFLIILPVAVYIIFVHRYASLYFFLTVGSILVTSTLLLNSIHDGWYNFYVILFQKSRSIDANFLLGFWTKDILFPLGIGCVLIACFFYERYSRRAWKDFMFYILFAAGLFGGSWASRVQDTAYTNVLFPAYACIAVLFGLAIPTLLTYIPGKKRGVVYIICILQFLALFYNPSKFIPTREDLNAGKEFIATISRMKGEIYVPFHGYLPVMAGKKSYAHAMAVIDILRSDNEEAKAKIEGEFNQAWKQKKFSAIIIDHVWYLEGFQEYYKVKSPVFDNESVFWPISGMRTRPWLIFVPRTETGEKK